IAPQYGEVVRSMIPLPLLAIGFASARSGFEIRRILIQQDGKLCHRALDIAEREAHGSQSISAICIRRVNDCEGFENHRRSAVLPLQVKRIGAIRKQLNLLLTPTLVCHFYPRVMDTCRATIESSIACICLNNSIMA